MLQSSSAFALDRLVYQAVEVAQLESGCGAVVEKVTESLKTWQIVVLLPEHLPSNHQMFRDPRLIPETL